MKIRGLIAVVALAAVAAAPVSAKDKKAEREGDPNSVVQCELRAQTVAEFELCRWLRMVADGQPTEWLEWRKEQ